MKISIVTAAFAVLFVSTGCGLGQGEGNKYEGLYQATGSVTLVGTSTARGETSAASGFRTIAEGLNSELIYADNFCSFPAEIEGSIATMKPNTPCTIVEGNITQNYTVSSGTMTLNDGIITVTISGTGTVSTPNGMVNFSFNINETLTRASKSNQSTL